MPYDLNRFIAAQERDYSLALSEIRAGRKESHWIWYIFPQLKELGYSFNAQKYGIADIGEAREYLAHPVLGSRLTEISEALLELDESDPVKVMHWEVDAMKLRSSMTLFACAAGEDSVFQRVLDRYFGGKPDIQTLKLLSRE